MYRNFALLLVLFFSTAIYSANTLANETDTRAIDYDIALDEDWTSTAQLTLPAESSDDLPSLVILFHGSGPYDMNATYSENPFSDEDPLSQNFLFIAETLAEQGVATLRFNKRGVITHGEYDQTQIQADLDQLVADANAVVDFALDLDSIDTEHIYLYGWSEGAWVIANVANQRDDLAGLIMQGAPNGSFAELIPYQYQDIALPYFREVIDADGDGLVAPADVAEIPAGPVQLMAPFFIYQPGSDPANPSANAFVDSNSDGLIAIDDELAPAIEMYIGNLPAFMPQTDARTDTAELIAEAGIPTLLLHGDMDGWTAISGAEAIAEANPDLVTLNVYEGLGHALSETEQLAEDGFYPMASAPLDDLVTWLAGQR
ncbi:MAG: prolyl oligopeptidase family serine peptidase [Chloroflexota bacterium]